MQFNFMDEVPFPRDLVFTTHRDRLVEMVDYLPAVSAIESVERVVEGDVVRLLNRWTGSDDEVPGVIRPFLKTEYLTWLDRAVWDEGRWRVDWELELGVLPGAIEARGHSEYEDEGDDTVIHMSGEFIVHTDRIPALPSALAGRSKPTIEKFVVGLVEPNLRRTNEGLARFLEEQGY